jgi:hypothetical protein
VSNQHAAEPLSPELALVDPKLARLAGDRRPAPGETPSSTQTELVVGESGFQVLTIIAYSRARPVPRPEFRPQPASGRRRYERPRAAPGQSGWSGRRFLLAALGVVLAAAVCAIRFYPHVECDLDAVRRILVNSNLVSVQRAFVLAVALPFSLKSNVPGAA